jgi:uncharacterized protein
VIAVDTNILVYAHRRDATSHQPAQLVVRRVAESSRGWAIPWPCLYEFLAIVTHPRIFRPPTPLDVALAQVSAWLEAPGVSLLAEEPGAWEVLGRLLMQGRVAGPAVHDARIAVICLLHSVSELWTADRDFSRFAGLSTRNPLVES